MNAILCTPVEAVKYRESHTPQELAWAKDIADLYCARPLKSDATQFYTFLLTFSRLAVSVEYAKNVLVGRGISADGKIY